MLSTISNPLSLHSHKLEMTPDQLIHLNVWMPKSTVVVLLTLICVCVSFTLDSLYVWIKTKVIKSNNDVIRTYPCTVEEDNSSILKAVSMMQEIQQQQEDILKSQLSLPSRQELLSVNLTQQKQLIEVLFKVINTLTATVEPTSREPILHMNRYTFKHFMEDERRR